MSCGEPLDGLAAELWHACEQEAQQALTHPFITSLSEGSLDW